MQHFRTLLQGKRVLVCRTDSMMGRMDQLQHDVLPGTPILVKDISLGAGLDELSVMSWRKRRDSNPRYPFGYASFQDWSHQPLGHSSCLKV